jgi:hypothetical protein
MNPTEAPEVDHVEEVVKEMREQLRATGETPERAKVRSAAFEQARKDHPNMWAACREVWDGDRLTEPLVVAAAPTIGEIRTLLRQLPSEQTAGVVLEFLGPSLLIPVHFAGRSPA